MNKISLKLAFEKETSSADDISEKITPEIKKKYNIPENASALSEGTQSAVYENSLGQIVAFTRANACDTAYKSVGKNSEILPEVYDLDKIEIYSDFEEGHKKLCVITMEKLTPLTSDDENQFRTATKLLRDWRNNNNKWEMRKEEAVNEYLGTENLNKTGTEILFLWLKMDELGIGHNDLHFGNIAWGKNGELKLIDWEDIYVPEYWV